MPDIYETHYNRRTRLSSALQKGMKILCNKKWQSCILKFDLTVNINIYKMQQYASHVLTLLHLMTLNYLFAALHSTSMNC